MNRWAFQRAMGRQPMRRPYGTMILPPAPEPLAPAALYHYWYPGRDGVEPCPKDFAARLADVHADLAICRPPPRAPTSSHPWLVWYRKPAITHWFSPGWMLIFVWQARDKTPLPLDDRLFANLYRCSVMAFGSAVKYFDNVVKTIQADQQRVVDKDKANCDAKNREFRASFKIKNIGKGNKFALHHDGSIVPSRGERNWQRERELHSLPGEKQAQLRDRRKQLASQLKDLG